MTTKVRVTIASVMLAGMLGLVLASDAFSGGGPEKDVQAAVVKIADAIKKGNMDEATKLAKKAAAMKELEDPADVMHLFKTHKQGGTGWGSKRAANPASDGIDKKLMEFQKNVKAADASDPNNEEAAYWTAAIIEISKFKGPANDMGGGKTKKAWADFSKTTSDASVAFAKAAAGKQGPAIKTAADKLYTSCTNCHTKFK